VSFTCWVELTSDEQTELRALRNSPEVPATVATRARIVLWHGEHLRKKDIAELAGVSRPTVDLWERFRTRRDRRAARPPSWGRARAGPDVGQGSDPGRNPEQAHRRNPACRSGRLGRWLPTSSAPKAWPSRITTWRRCGGTTGCARTGRVRSRSAGIRSSRQPARALPFHPDRIVLDQPDRELVRHHHPSVDPPRQLQAPSRPCSTRSATTSTTGTPTPSHSSGPPPPTRSSPKSASSRPTSGNSLRTTRSKPQRIMNH
jgi:hypothetical protein